MFLIQSSHKMKNRLPLGFRSEDRTHDSMLIRHMRYPLRHPVNVSFLHKEEQVSPGATSPSCRGTGSGVFVLQAIIIQFI